MPKIFEWKGYKFFFYSNEGVPLEKRHVHIRKGSNTAKFFVDPIVSLATSWGFDSKELNTLGKQVESNLVLIRSKWDEYFNPGS